MPDRSTLQRSAIRTRVGERVREVLEHRRHLLGGLQVELVAVVLQPIGVVDRLAGADAEQDVVRLEVGVLQVVDVVGDDQIQVEVLRDRLQPDVDDLLLLDALVLHLEEEVLGAEDVAVRGRGVRAPSAAARCGCRWRPPP